MYVCVSAIPCVYMYAMRAYAHTYVMHLYLYTCIYVYTRMGAFALVLVCVSFLSEKTEDAQCAMLTPVQSWRLPDGTV